MVTDSAAAERRRVALVDGGIRHELVVSADASLADLLEDVGVPMDAAARLIVVRDGTLLDLDALAGSLHDGEVIAVVEVAPPTASPARQHAGTEAEPDRAVVAGLWALGAVGLVATALGLLLPHSFTGPVRWVAVALLAAGAVAVGLGWVRRARGTAVPALAPLALAFAAGVCSVPILPAATASTAALLGLASAAVLASALALLARDEGVRAGAGAGAILLVAVAVVWGGALLVGLQPAGAAAIVLGATPVALRALPAFLLDVPPGQFIEYARFQRLRWTVREQTPEPGERVTESSVRRLVDGSSARLVIGTAALSLAAAVAAPLAVPAFGPADPLVFGGQIGLLAASSLALLLGARRSAVPALHVMPRVAGVAVLVVALHAILGLGIGSWTAAAAVVLLLVGLVVGVVVVPVSRGARSLFWSRAGDLLEVLATVLALPAALVAGGVIDLLRGMMAT